MDIIHFSIKKPVTVIVGVILVVMFGLIGLSQMPYQLSPTVEKPEISITTFWPGSTPYEVEREIIDEQEDVLKGVPNLTEMESACYDGFGMITLRFKVGTDKDAALLDVSNKLDEVPAYPDNVEKPVISGSGSTPSPVIWLLLKTVEGNENSINNYRTYFEDEVKQYLERVDGVGDLFVGGGTEREMHVVLDPDKLAAYDLTVSDVIGVLQAENVNISAGEMSGGRRDYRIRTVSEYQAPEDIKNVVLVSDGQRRVTVGQVARVDYGFGDLEAAIIHNGEPAIVCGVEAETGANIPELTDRVEVVVNELNNGILKDKGLFLDWTYDQRPYINGAINLVKQNIIIGGILAIIVLLLFLGSFSSTIIVAFSIPVSIIGSFIIMKAAGRTLNVVSLAGISFAVGMLVDNAIVVLENIDRHRGMGKRPFAAAYDGAKEVWGAVLASTLTTVAVFLPVVFIEEEAGQLFKDIAIAVTCAIFLSLFVSVSVIPMLSRMFFRLSRRKKEPRKVVGAFGRKVSEFIMSLVGLAVRTWTSRFVTVVSLTLVSVLLAWLLMPKMEYLPQGNRNLILNIFIPPPGLSTDEQLDIGEQLFAQTAPFFDQDQVNGLPGIKEMFFVGHPRIMLAGVISTQEQRAGELIPMFMGLLNSFPGMYGVSLQASIFEEGLGEGRNINVDLSGASMEQLVAAAGTMYGSIMQKLPGSQIRPLPSLELTYPEVRFLPKKDRLRAVNMSASQLGENLDVLMDGRDIGDFKREGEKSIDLVLKASEDDFDNPEDLYRSLVVTPGGGIVPVSSLSDIFYTSGMTQIRHLERRRTVTLQVTPPEEVPLQAAMEMIESEVIPGVEQTGLMQGITSRLSGAADKLTQTWSALQWNFLLAVVITYLLMSALFGNFIYPFVIMFTVPLAAAGGFVGLALVNLLIAPQPLDILTMLGFVILIGVVVNNAILIVHQSLNNIREGNMQPRQAVLESTQTRLRPIYMSACTSIFGMLPLVVAPGPGSELYRGLGSVVLGGLAMSTVLTVFVIPCLLMFFLKMEKVEED